jgi:L-cystine transport system ATP-binding protein
MSSPLIELSNIALRYGRTEILHNLSLSFPDQSITAVIGPSGAGKSALLRCLALTDCPSRGTISFQGQVAFDATNSVHTDCVENYRRRVGMVFQELFLWPHLTIQENVELPLLYGRRLSTKKATICATDYLVRLELESLASRYPSELSVGQKQRCAIARTLAMDPEVVLLDEITSALDPELVVTILALIHDIASLYSKTVIAVTHDITFLSKTATNLILLDSGTIGYSGPVESGLAEPRVAAFLASAGRGRPHKYLGG